MALDSQNNTRTAAELEAAVWDILWGLKQRPLALGKYVLDYSTLKGFLTSNLYDAAGWPALAQTLALLLENDIPALTAWAEALFASSSNNYDAVRAAARTTYALMGIHCGERTARAGSFEEILPSAERLFDTSRSMGDLTTLLTMVCAQVKQLPPFFFFETCIPSMPWKYYNSWVIVIISIPPTPQKGEMKRAITNFR